MPPIPSGGFLIPFMGATVQEKLDDGQLKYKNRYRGAGGKQLGSFPKLRFAQSAEVKSTCD